MDSEAEAEGQVTMSTYRIVRKYQRSDVADETIDEDLTLEEAQAHCNDPETSSKTCRGREGLERTERFGAWFDSYYEE